MANLISSIGAIMNFRPDMESIKGNKTTLIRVIRPGSTSSRDQIRKAGRKMGDQIMAVGNSPAIRDVGNDSRSKVIVTNSGRSESVELHLVLGDDAGHTGIQSGVGSESTSQTVASEENLIVLVLVKESLEVVHEVVSEEISIFNIEIAGGDSVVDGVETVGDSVRLKGFFGELGSALGSTESDDDSFGGIVDEERVRNGFSAPESVGVLVGKSVAFEVVTGITTLHSIEVVGFAVRGRGSTEKFASKAFVVGLNGGDGENGEEKEGSRFKGHDRNK